MILDAPNTITDVERQRRCDAHVGYPNDKWLVWTVKRSFISASGEGRSQTIGQSVQHKKNTMVLYAIFSEKKNADWWKKKDVLYAYTFVHDDCIVKLYIHQTERVSKYSVGCILRPSA